jgi:hypothetical protein
LLFEKGFGQDRNKNIHAIIKKVIRLDCILDTRNHSFGLELHQPRPTATTCGNIHSYNITTDLTIKPTSPLSLLLFLQLASALPLPTKQLLLINCHHYTYHSLSKPSTPPTKAQLSEPHFPSHQLSSPADNLNEIYDNAPRTPTPNTPLSKALSSQHPLSSSYLLSLPPASNPATVSTSALLSKPTSELPNLEEDAQRYWAS